MSADNKHIRTEALYAFIYKCLALHDTTETNYIWYSQNAEDW